MKSVSDFSFHLVQGAVSAEIGAEVVTLWTTAAGLDVAAAQKRLGELVLVLKYKSEKIVGMSTAVKTYLPQIQQYVFAYRCFISHEFRAPALDTQMIVRSKKHLAEISASEHVNKAVGILVIIQNQMITEHWRQAVWLGADMMYIGSTPQGHHLRLGYFDGAMI